MVLSKIPKIFRNKSMEEGERVGRERGRQEFIDAAAGEIPEEVLERIKERLARDKDSDS